MESVNTVLKLVTPNCWMGSLDLTDAYYSVKIHPDFLKKVYAPAQENLLR